MSQSDMEQYKVRLPTGTKNYIRQAAQVRGFNSMSEYTRQLLFQDMEDALSGFSRLELTKDFDNTGEKDE